MNKFFISLYRPHGEVKNCLSLNFLKHHFQFEGILLGYHCEVDVIALPLD